VTPTAQPCRLVVCRGCCCGTKKKRPGVDHKGQLRRLGGLTDHEGRDVPMRTSTCLGICFKANVVVVQPSSRGRAAGGRPVWFGDVTEDRLIDRLDDWIFAGGPGIAPVPEELEPHLTSKDAKKPKKAKGKKKDKKDKKARKKAAKAAAAKRERAGAAPGGADAAAGRRSEEKKDGSGGKKARKKARKAAEKARKKERAGAG
jgi:(2Fe-2S) ferredoxin